ncbi:MAG: histidine phosphatase family protein [Spirochaetales bacterium]|nr:histidine phosphatase family protein [Spirochaetales bacterium]
MITTLTVIRHGETEWNRKGKQQGHDDSPLSETGIEQALAIAAWLKPVYDVLIASDLGRAVQTAKIIGEAAGLAVTAEKGLRERHLGIMQGLTMEEFREKHAEAYASFRSHDTSYVIPGGESVRQRHERITACFRSIASSHEGKNILVVTHGGSLDSLIRFVLSIPLTSNRQFSLVNGSINRFSVTDGTWRLESWGETGHLAGIAALDDF